MTSSSPRAGAFGDELTNLALGALIGAMLLAVVPRDVVQSRDGRDLADCGVESVLIVEVQPCREGVAAG